MQLTVADFNYLGLCMEGFWFGTLSVLQMPRPLTKSHYTVSGLYSGIFAMYLSYYGSKDTNKTKNILYYALCVLYVLSVATLSLDIGIFVYEEVSSQPIHKISFMLISCAVRHRLLYQDSLDNLDPWYHSSWLLRLYRPVNLSMHKLPCL